jgi:hypothetical protein
MRFRQVHLDFHTSEHISGIGTAFNKAEWQQTLQKAAVDSITVFAVCHHGWSYYPTKIGKVHPHLQFDLLRQQMDACHEIGVATPVYLTAGLYNSIANEHPEWREWSVNPAVPGWQPGPLEAGFKLMCFNTPYLDLLCRQIEEVVTNYPDADGIFLDIIFQGECCCKWCMKDMIANGYDPEKSPDRRRFADSVLEKYYQKTTAAVRCRDPKMRVFHNSGHVSPRNIEKLKYFSHLELESLPTGGWGYDHFPQSAAFARKTGMDFLGMTGKFHSSWGEFGGFKHPNALRYECMAMIANGARCSIGDQLHPCGKLDAVTYDCIGTAYREVKQKEPWCVNAVNLADIAIIPQEALNAGSGRDFAGDIGAARILLESHYLFDIINPEMDFSQYKLLILPDAVEISAALELKLKQYLSNGGKILLSGDGGIRNQNFIFDVGATYHGKGESNPSYIRIADEFLGDWGATPMVMYDAAHNIKAANGKSTGAIYNSYFNRSYRHFCSHQHTPNQTEPNGFDAGVISNDGCTAYLAHPVFTLYRQTGAVFLRQYLASVIDYMLAGTATITTNLPSSARCVVTEQPQQQRLMIHLLYGSLVLRGGGVPTVPWLSKPIEVIEELLPLHNITVAISTDKAIKTITSIPDGSSYPFTQTGGICTVTIPSFTCHALLEYQY